MTKCPSTQKSTEAAAVRQPAPIDPTAKTILNQPAKSEEKPRSDRFNYWNPSFLTRKASFFGHPLFPSLPIVATRTNFMEDRVSPARKITEPQTAKKEMDGFDFLIEQVLPRVEEGYVRIAHFSVNDGKNHPRYTGLTVLGEPRPTRFINFVKSNTESYLDAEFKKVRGVPRLVGFRLLFSKPLMYEIEQSPGKYRKFPVYGVRLIRSPDGIIRADPILVAKKIKNPCMTPPKPDPKLPLGDSAIIAYTLKPETEDLPEGFPKISQSLKDKIVSDVLEDRGYTSGLLFLLELFAYEWGIDCKVFEENGVACHTLPTDLTALFKVLRYILDPEYAEKRAPKTYDSNHSYEDENGKVKKIPTDPQEVAKINAKLPKDRQIQCSTDEKTQEVACNRGTYAAPTEKTKGKTSVVVGAGRFDLPYGLGTIFLESATRISVSYDPKRPAGTRVSLTLESLAKDQQIKIRRSDLKIEGYGLKADWVKSPTVTVNFDPMAYEPSKKSKELPPFSLSFENPEVQNFTTKDPAGGNLFVEKGRLDSMSIVHRYEPRDKKHKVHLKVQGLQSSGYARTHGLAEGEGEQIPFAISMAGSSKLDLDSEISWTEGEDRMVAVNNLRIAGAVDSLNIKNNGSPEADLQELRFKSQGKTAGVNPIRGEVITATVFSRNSGEILAYDYEAHLDLDHVGIELDGTIPIKVKNIEAKAKIQSAHSDSLHIDIIANPDGWKIETQAGKSKIEAYISADLKITDSSKTVESSITTNIELDLRKIEYLNEEGLVEFDAGIHADIQTETQLKEFLKIALKPILLSKSQSADAPLPSIQEVVPDLPRDLRQKLVGNFLRVGKIHYTRAQGLENIHLEESIGSIVFGTKVRGALLAPYEHVLFRLPLFSNGEKKRISKYNYFNILLGRDSYLAWPKKTPSKAD